MKTSVLILIALAVILSLFHIAFGQNKYREQLVFYDDFLKLDNSIWSHAITLTGGGNWEFQQYVNNRSTSWVDDGVLYLKPMLTEDFTGSSISAEGASIDLWGAEVPDYCTSNFQWGCYRTAFSGHVLNPITSARVRTTDSFSFKYGRVEIRAKLPRGDWIWPAIWLMPRYSTYGPWPASGEVDIAESRGNVRYLEWDKEGGIETYATTMHWGPFTYANGFWLTHELRTLTNGRDFNDDFHVFGLYWDKDRIYFYLDDRDNIVMDVDLTVPFWERAKQGGYNWEERKLHNPWVNAPTRAPFNQEFFLIMNNAVGTTNGYFSDSIPTKPWRNNSPTAFTEFWNARNQWLSTWKGNDTALQVDYVKIWVFPEISTYTIKNNTISGHFEPHHQPADVTTGESLVWPYIVAVSALILSLLSGTLAVIAIGVVIGYRLKKEKKKKEKEGRIDHPMAESGQELVEREARTVIAE